MNTSTKICWVNGQQTDVVNAFDRGLHYGDGVFETLAVEDGKPGYWLRHIERLEKGAAALGIPVDGRTVLVEQLAEVAEETGRGAVKIIVTRGAGGRGYAPPDDVTPTTLILGYPGEIGYDGAGLEIGRCSTVLGCSSTLAGLKHLNRLEQILACRELEKTTWNDGLLRDNNGHFIESTTSNLFIVKKGEMLTPSLTRGGVTGIMREIVMETASATGIPITVAELTSSDLADCDEIFLTNSVRGIQPVVRYDSKPYPDHAIADRLRSLVPLVGESDIR